MRRKQTTISIFYFKKMRIVYMGTPEFAVEPLRRLVEGGYNIVAVVTVPDKPAGRGLKLQQSAVKQYAESKGLKIMQPERLKNEQWVEEFRSLNADLAIVVAFRMLPEIIWSMPRLGTFNLHSSLLPRYRGAAPINWAIINGDTESGVTTFMLNHEIDCGAIIGQKSVAIGSDETAGELHDKLMMLGADLVIETVEQIAEGKVEPQPQIGDATPAPKIFKDDCRIEWSNSTASIYNKIRGLSPYPAAWFEIMGTTAKIFESHYEIAQHNAQTGTIDTDGKSWLRIATVDGWIYIDRIQLSGKKAMLTADFLRGNKI